METNAIFEAEALCHEPGCEQINLYLSLVSFDENHRQGAIDHGQAVPMRADGPCRVRTSAAAASVSVSLYAVPAEGPATDRVADAPDLKLLLTVKRDGQPIGERIVRVNRWGGTQLIGMNYE